MVNYLKLFLLIFFIFFQKNLHALENKYFNIGSKIEFKNKILFMRHGLAPGYGDPHDFKIGNCKTQRNLSKNGIEKLKSISIKFKINKIKFKKVYSSYWCRCYQTAEVLGYQKYEKHEGLNSFFQDHFDKNQTLAKLDKLIKSLEKTQSDEPYLFVTHYVNILSFTGFAVASGDIVVYDLKTKKSLKLHLEENYENQNTMYKNM